MKVIALAVLAVPALLFIPTTWQQQSFAGVPYQLPSAVAVAPTANDVRTWSQTDGGTGFVPLTPLAIVGVQPDRPHQWAVITDIGFEMASGGTARVWWIRDGNTGQILFSGPLSVGGFSGDRQMHGHLSTPIVLDHGGANPPVFEVGGYLGDQAPGRTWRYSISVMGRYVYDM